MKSSMNKIQMNQSAHQFENDQKALNYLQF